LARGRVWINTSGSIAWNERSEGENGDDGALEDLGARTSALLCHRTFPSPSAQTSISASMSDPKRRHWNFYELRIECFKMSGFLTSETSQNFLLPWRVNDLFSCAGPRARPIFLTPRWRRMRRKLRVHDGLTHNHVDLVFAFCGKIYNGLHSIQQSRHPQ
jgi:hypothetical protein